MPEIDVGQAYDANNWHVAGYVVAKPEKNYAKKR